MNKIAPIRSDVHKLLPFNNIRDFQEKASGLDSRNIRVKAFKFTPRYAEIQTNLSGK